MWPLHRVCPKSARVAGVHFEGAQVLAISEDAAMAIRGIVGSEGIPDGAGLRITREETTDPAGKPRIHLRL